MSAPTNSQQANNQATGDQFSIAQLLQKSQTANSYNWIGVLEFLHQQHKTMHLKEAEWSIEKNVLTGRIKELEGIIAGLERVVTDLGRRCKMLEVALRQERLKYHSNNSYPDFVGPLLQENIDANLNNLSTVPKRKARPYRPLLQKILQEVGIQQIFSPPGSPRENNKESNRPSVTMMQTPNQTSTINPNNSNSARQSPISRSNYNTQTIIRKVEDQKEPLIYKSQLSSHFDGVRSAVFLKKIPVLASVSEDCQVKLWNISSMNDAVDPYLSLREHTGPIFTVVDYEAQRSQNPNFIFTAGSEGVIKAWQVPNPEDIHQYGPVQEHYSSYNSWNAHQESIWQLSINQTDGLLLSGSADGVVKLWQLQQDVLQKQEPKAKMVYSQKSNDQVTALTWLPNKPHFMASFPQNAILTYDAETGKVVSTIKYNSDRSAQVNKICPSQVLLTAHEDDRVRLFDPQSGKMVNQVVVHNDSVTSVVTNQIASTFFTVSHDGHLKVWDIRKLNCLVDHEIHLPKYDEAIHDLVICQNRLASCGADGLIKLFTGKTV